MPFAVQGLIGTLAGPEDPGTAFVGFYHDLGEADGVPGAWGYARGGMGAVTAALRAAAEAAGATRAAGVPRGAGARWRTDRAEGVVIAGGEEVRARAVLLNCDPLASAAAGRASTPPRGWRQAGPVVKVMVLLDGLPDFPAWPGPEPWQGAIDIGFTLDDLTAAAEDARAGRPAARAVDRGRLPDGHRRLAGASRSPRAVDVLPVLSAPTPTPRPRPTPRSPASPRCAPSCPTASSTAWRSARASSRRASASPAATSSTARCCPGQLLEQRPDRRALRRHRGPLPRRVGRPPGRRGERRAGPAGRARGARGRGGRLSRGALSDHARGCPAMRRAGCARPGTTWRFAAERLPPRATSCSSWRRASTPCSRCSPTRSTPS